MSGQRRRSAGPSFGRTWWGRAWVTAIEERAQLDPNRLPRGAAYARSGAVGDLVTAPGEVRARVGGRDSRPYDVHIRVRRFDETQWRQVFDVIGAQLAYTAALLEGQLPPDVATDLDRVGLSLLPGPGEVGPRCSCPDDADPCKHAAAVCYLVADALDADPFVVLLLRGRTREEVLAGLRSRRRVTPDDAADGAADVVVDAADGAADVVVDAADDAADVVGGADRAEASRTALPAASRPADEGVDAREVLAASAWPDVPVPPMPPSRPGRPVAWPFDPPERYDEVRTDLMSLAADAARRAWELAVGAVADAGLALDGDADLARRAETVLGTGRFATLAKRCGVGERELVRWALAWRYGGRAGFDVLRTPWEPRTEPGADRLMTVARSALTALQAADGAPARVRANRVTAGDRQVRLGRDLRWYPYRRVHHRWEPAGPPETGPSAAADGR